MKKFEERYSYCWLLTGLVLMMLSYGVQARAIECGFSVLRNPVNGNIILYDYHGRPLHMANAMNVHTGVIFLDIPKEGRQTFYAITGNWFPWICMVYSVFALFSGLLIKRKEQFM